LRKRELIAYVYKEIEAEAELDDGQRVAALTYVADYDHAQFAGGLSLEETLAVIRRSSGRSGANVEYVLSAHAELENLGIEDEALWRVCEGLKEG
jgi:cation transport protein ChaC